MTDSNKTSRRSFLKTTGTSAFALGLSASAPTIVPQHVIGATPPSDKFVVGMIGLGWRGIQLMRTAMRKNDLQIAAVCDLDLPYLLHGQQMLDKFMEVDRQWIEGDGSGMKRAPLPDHAVDAYLEYEKMYERKDLDAVIIAVPDHWHAKLYIEAMHAGFDVYGEKPLSLTIDEGRKMVRAARENNRVFQTGSQQRSANEFRTACEYVRNGRLGQIERVEVGIGGAPKNDPVPDEPEPWGLNWDKWLGQAPKVPYNPLRCHVTFRWFFDYSGGMITDWGAHHLDIAQWGLGMDGSGPSAVEGSAQKNPSYYTTFTSYDFTFSYPNDVNVHFHSKGGGITFIGPKGKINVNRGHIESDPADILEEPLTSNDIRLYESNDHMQNWIDCMKSRERPITDVEIGHTSATVCHLANICGHLGRKLEWDPEKELFINDPEANHYLSRTQREPYVI